MDDTPTRLERTKSLCPACFVRQRRVDGRCLDPGQANNLTSILGGILMSDSLVGVTAQENQQPLTSFEWLLESCDVELEEAWKLRNDEALALFHYRFILIFVRNLFNNWFCGVVGYHFCLTHRRS
jgi:hypothetical protein